MNSFLFMFDTNYCPFKWRIDFYSTKIIAIIFETKHVSNCCVRNFFSYCLLTRFVGFNPIQ